MLCTCCQEGYTQGIALPCSHELCIPCYKDTLSIDRLKCCECNEWFLPTEVTIFDINNHPTVDNLQVIKNISDRHNSQLELYTNLRQQLQTLLCDINTITSLTVADNDDNIRNYIHIVKMYIADIIKEYEDILSSLRRMRLNILPYISGDDFLSSTNKYDKLLTDIEHRLINNPNLNCSIIFKSYKFKCNDLLFTISSYLRSGSISSDEDLVKYKNTKYVKLAMIKYRVSLLQHIEDQTPEICLEAVKENGFALQFVKEQTPELCLLAVKKNGYALEFVKEQTPEICIEAVKQDGRALQFVKEQTPEICLEAVKQVCYALEFVKEQTPEICIEAVKQNGTLLQYVRKQTPEICLEAVKKTGTSLQYVKEQTPEICLEAICNSMDAIRYASFLTEEISLEIVRRNGLRLQQIKKKFRTPEICLQAVKNNGLALQYVLEQTPEICLEAVKQNGEALAYVKEQTPEICRMALRNKMSSVSYLDEQMIHALIKVEQ